MRQYPECLNRRYQALDDLISELGAVASDHSQEVGSAELSPTDPGIKLMCKFWNILKEDPDCNLENVVQQRMELNTRGSGFVKPQKISCYACSEDNQQSKDSKDKMKTLCCSSSSGPPSANASVSHDRCMKSDGGGVPLSKVLCNLKRAASVDKKCSEKIKELKTVQKQVAEQVEELERREKEGTKNMKQADCMWSCMEETYKQKIAESIERQKELMKQQRDVESHVSKWRKSKKELDLQMKQLEKCQKEIKEKLNQKSNDLKCIKTEVTDLKKRIENNAKDTEGVKQSTSVKKRASADRVAKVAQELKKLQEIIANEHKIKKQKEEDGHRYIKEAREDLQNICRILLQKKLENEDVKAEMEAILDEIELLKRTTDQCQDKCKNKQNSLRDELKKVKGDIASFRARCTSCHACVDTHDSRRFCTDCPKCHEERECLYSEGQCTEDTANDCICIAVKRRFLDNVFDNMYSVLDRQSKTAPGKVLAEQVLACLQNSRNGKLTEPIRKALQEFVLVTVKKNLNLTIIGGAVKTRCEMDPDTYKQLMNCLAKLTVSPPEKKDQATAAKKDSCKRWGGTGECNCPSGPKFCVCTRKAPPPATDPTPCPQLEEDKQDIGATPVCPHQEASIPCGPDCGNTKVSDTVKDLVKSFNPTPCSGQSCTFSKNLRAAQCMLGQDSVNTISRISKSYLTRTPYVPDVSKYNNNITNTPFVPDLDGLMACSCGCASDKECSCYNDCKRCKKGKKEDKEAKYGHANDDNNESKRSVFKNDLNPTNNGIKEHTKQNTVIIKENPPKTEDAKQATKQNKEINEERSNDRDVPLVQAEVLTNAHQECGTDPYITTSKRTQHRISLQQLVNDLTNEMPPKDLFKVAIPNDDGETHHEFTELTATSSGSIQMALDEKLIASIDSKTRQNPNLNIALSKTISGHFIVEFNKCDCNSSESRRVVVNRTDSGSIIMEVHKNLIDTIQPSIIKSTPNTKKNISQKPSITVGLSKKKRKHSCDVEYFDSNDEENHKPSVKVVDNEEKNGVKVVKLKESSQLEDTSTNSKPPSLLVPPLHYSIISSSTNSGEQDDLITSGIGEKKGYHNIPKHHLKHENDDINVDRVQIKLVNDSTSTNAIDLKLKEKDKFRCLKKIDRDIGEQNNKTGTEKDERKPFNTNKDFDNFLALKDNFIKMIENKRTFIDVTVLGENGVESNIKAELMKTKSGQIAIDAKAIVKSGQIASRLKEYPISFVRTSSRYLLNFGERDKNANAVLKRSSSGVTHVVLQNPIVKLDENNAATLRPKEEFFKVRVKGVERSDPIPTSVMRLTCSDNYVFVLDKEFENLYLQTIKKCVGDDHECHVCLSKTKSDCFIIDFNEKMDNVNNALLVKSHSGNIKLLVQSPAFEAIHKNPESNQRSSTVFQELFTKLPHSSREFHRENLAKSKYLETKSFSDSGLYDKVRIQDQNSLLVLPLAVLKRTASGKYAVVLNKESKQTFVNNLKSYISSSGQAFVPIMKTDQGDIIISLRRGHKGVYGSVKITPSGNIYVSVDENVLRQMKNDTTDQTNELISEQSSRSVHMIGTIMHPQHKEVTTTCHAQPDICSCDASKCVCNELKIVGSSCIYANAEKNAKSNVIFECNQFQVKAGITNYPYPMIKKQRNESFYIIDTTAHPGDTQSDNSVEQDKNIPRHQNYTENVTMKEQYFEMGEQSYTNIYQRRDTSNLDYLEFLPPQLPIFLRNID